MARGKAQKTLDLIEAINAILDVIAPAGVRAICYQLFVQGLIPSMARKETNRISDLLVTARDDESVDWRRIVDPTRTIDIPASWANVAEYVETVRHSFRKDHWALQPRNVIVLSEKETVAGTLRPVLRRYGVGFLPLHGHSSYTRARQLAEDTARSGKDLVPLYVGDWDVAGMDMSERDLPKRFIEFWWKTVEEFDLDYLETPIVIPRRIALVRSDCYGTDLPSFPARSKSKDTRYPWYLEEYGPLCWELDALSPAILRDRVEEAIQDEIDWDLWERSEAAAQAESDSIERVLGAWNQDNEPPR